MHIFSLMTHSKQLLLVTFCNTTAGNEAFFGHMDGHTDTRTHGWKDRRGSRNSYLDAQKFLFGFGQS